jgi:hypothetical protein
MEIVAIEAQKISLLSAVLDDNKTAIGAIQRLAQIDLNERAAFVDFRNQACISACIADFGSPVSMGDVAKHWFETGDLPDIAHDAGIEFIGEEPKYLAGDLRRRGYAVWSVHGDGCECGECTFTHEFVGWGDPTP